MGDTNDKERVSNSKKLAKKEKKKERRSSSSTTIKKKHAPVRQDDDDEDHHREVKRLRTYSTELESNGTTATGDKNNNRVRTRSIDIKEQTDDEWRLSHTITVQGVALSPNETIPKPYRTFDQAPFCTAIQRSLTQAGYTAPTPIQAQAWPIAIAKQDMISIAKTGSGKTCGFLLPVFHNILQVNKPSKLPQLLVLAPTRELSVQIMEESSKFGRSIRLRSVCCYGGSSKYPQIAALSRGVDIVIATPGRLNDLLEMKKADLSNIQYLVLDEADRMLDMGFEPQIRSIVNHVPNQRQTLLFSATWPREIQRLANDFLQSPVQINVGEVNALVANKDIKQNIVMCRETEKHDKLTEILKDVMDTHEASGDRQQTAINGAKNHAKTIVFCAKKISCHELANQLWEDGYAVDSLHGDRPQWERTRVMGAFKNGQLRLLIATDVAARGLDVKDVQVVVNYDMPPNVEDYVHRIGRTGRAGATGVAYTLFTDSDKKAANQLVQVLKKSEQEIPSELQRFVRPSHRFGGGRGGRGGRGYMGGGGGRGYGGRSSHRGGYSGGRSYGGRGGRGRGRGGYGRY